ncbi:hypothetical protein HK097_005260 [Rhizophlyctis rosea]|uniref:Tryptophan synthase beta chain-like PALP domain-containing protein n=1 Tax=Rhizophlyctis rosea TaxID=64517 RepID=A0AAD5SGX4_9FUNG|nr:hypothetical protein HK097_005260 [Rhizophlyctis rosea]
MTATPNLSSVQAAARLIKGKAHITPVLTSTTLSTILGPEPITNEPRHLFFKCENFQKVGAFKFRGACNAVFRLPEDAAAKGVVTHSSGNHAQALALAARMRNIPCYVVMPSNAPQVKKAAVKGYGAEIIECEPNLEARETTSQRVLAETGGTFIHPYNHPDVISGQGTLCLELLQQAEEMGSPLDALIVPVGGGGMLSGCIVAGKGLRPDLRIFAAEPEGADDCARSFAAKEWIPQTSPNTIADGLLTSTGEIAWPLIRDNCEDILTVSEQQIIDAMRLVFERMKLVIEPSSAVGVAAALYSEGFTKLEGIKNVGVVLCGGNVNLDQLPWNAAQ